jgi:flagellar motor switch protein FliN
MTEKTENPSAESEDPAHAEDEHADIADAHDLKLPTHDDDEDPSLEDFKPMSPGNINPEVLQNISVTLSIEVGRAQIKIKDLMRLTQGSVVELDRIAGEPLDLLVNNSVVAQGEIVLVNDRYGVRLTRVVPSSERLKLI